MSGPRRIEDALALYESGVSGDGNQRNPFKLLDAYERDERDIFFGRDAEIDELTRRYYRARVLLLFGESGAGKTSLLQCGLQNAIPEEDATFVFVRANVDPLAALRGVLGGLDDEALSLHALIVEHAEACSRTVVVVLDQAEELFILLPEPRREQFVAALAEALALGGDFKLLVSIREEYLGRLTTLEHRWLGVMANRYHLRRMGAADAERVIVGSCERGGVVYQPNLPAEVVARLRDAKGEVDLPYLQVVLDRLFRLAEARAGGSAGGEERVSLTLPDLDALGSLGDILGAFLEERVEGLEDPTLGRRLLKGFITPEHTRQVVALDDAIADVEASPEAVSAILQAFVTARILRPLGEQGFELRHDSLAGAIGRWLTPLEEERLRLEAVVAGRFRENQAGGALIESEDLLERVMPYLPHMSFGERTREVRDFVQRSRNALARARARRLRLATVVVLTAVAVLSALAGWALVMQGRATDALDHAQLALTRAEQERARADDASLMAAARLAETDGEMAAARVLLAAVGEPEQIPLWRQSALDSVVEAAPWRVMRGIEGQWARSSIVPTGKAITLTPEPGLVLSFPLDGRGPVTVLVAGEPSPPEEGTTGDAKNCASFRTMDVSPDGRKIVTGSLAMGGPLLLWQLDDLREPQRLMGHESCVNDVDFGPDGTSLVSSSIDGSVLLWELAGSPQSEVLTHGHDRAAGASFSPDGRFIIADTGDTLRVWRRSDRQVVLEYAVEGERLWSFQFNNNGSKLAAVFSDGIIRIWDLVHPGPPENLRVVEQDVVGLLAYFPDGRLVSGTERGDILVWDDTRDRNPQVHYRFGDSIVGISEGNDSDLWVHSREGARMSFDKNSRPSWGIVTSSVAEMAASPDGRFVAALHNDEVVMLHDADRLGLGVALEQGTWTTSLQFSIDGSTLVTTRRASPISIRLWKPSGAVWPARLNGGEHTIVAAEYSLDGGRILGMTEAGPILIWNRGNPDPIAILGKTGTEVHVAFFDPVGERVVAGSNDGVARVWDLRSSGPPVLLEGHGGAVLSALFSPDGTRIATASEDGTARVWWADGHGDPIVLSGHSGTVNRAVFSPNSASVATCSQDGTARVWPLAEPSAALVLEGHDDAVLSVEFSPSGQRVVTTSQDGSVRSWATDGPSPSEIIGEFDAPPYFATYSPDGSEVLTGVADGSVHTWRADREAAADFVLVDGEDWSAQYPLYAAQGSFVAMASGMTPEARVYPSNSSTPSLSVWGDSILFGAQLDSTGRELLTWSLLGTARIWPFAYDLLRDALLQDVEPCLGPEDRVRYLNEEPATAEARWRGCELACWDRTFPDDKPVEHVACPREGAPLQPR